MGAVLGVLLGYVNGAITSVSVCPQVLTTIEGIIDRAVAGLEQDQPTRRVRGWKGKLLRDGKCLGCPSPACCCHAGLVGRALGLCFVPWSPLAAALGFPCSS